MLPILLFLLSLSGLNGAPKTVKENLLRNVNVHSPKQEVVLRPQEVKEWPEQPLNVGQITGVSINSLGQPVIFHRAERILDLSVLEESTLYYTEKGPIVEDTILVLDPQTGSVLHSWGANTFYMPHGLTIDDHENVWVTDVILHQVFKYSPLDYEYPILTIGEAFTTSNSALGNRLSQVQFCMPTSVAVATTGEFFVADGYCNNRILKFNAAGELLLEMPLQSDTFTLNLPHSITLLEHRDIVCVADRQNLRIVCPKAGLKRDVKMSDPATIIEYPTFGRVFGVESHGDTIYAVNGENSLNIPIRGFTVNALTGSVLDTWEPVEGFIKPHEVAVAKDGSHLYVTEIGPNRIWKFELTDVNAK